MALKNFLVAIGLIFFSAIVVQAAEKIRFATHFKMNASYTLPALAAFEKGFWKQQGLEVDWVPFDSTEVMTRATAAGTIEAGTSGFYSLTGAAAAGVPQMIVADWGLVTEFFFWVASGGRLREPKDLKGARIGISRLGVSPYYLARIVVKNLGLEKEVKFVGLGGGGPAVAALKAGRVDAVAFSDFTLLPLKAKGEVRELLRMYDYLPKGLESKQIVFAHKDFAKREPEATRKVIAGFFQGCTFAKQDHAWAVEKMKSYLRYPEEAAQLALGLLRYSPDGRIEKNEFEAGLKAVGAFLAEYGLIPREKLPPVSELYTDKFVQ